MFFIKLLVLSGENFIVFYLILSLIFWFIFKIWIRNINYIIFIMIVCIGNKWKKIGIKNINNFNIIYVGVFRLWGKIIRFFNKYKWVIGILILEFVILEFLLIFERNM